MFPLLLFSFIVSECLGGHSQVFSLILDPWWCPIDLSHSNGFLAPKSYLIAWGGLDAINALWTLVEVDGTRWGGLFRLGGQGEENTGKGWKCCMFDGGETLNEVWERFERWQGVVCELGRTGGWGEGIKPWWFVTQWCGRRWWTVSGFWAGVDYLTIFGIKKAGFVCWAKVVGWVWFVFVLD